MNINGTVEPSDILGVPPYSETWLELSDEDKYNQYTIKFQITPLEHIKYSCDVPCWFTDQYNKLIDVVNDLQQKVGNSV